MVERQYDQLRKERMKGLEEQKPKPEENGASIAEPPAAAAAAPTTAEEAQSPVQEVHAILVSLCCFTDKIFQLTESCY